MARKYQEGEKMQTIATRMGTALVARIDAYGARLKAQHPGLRVERADAVRDLMLKALALVEGNGPSGPGDAGVGPREAPVQDLSPHGEDQTRTPGRTGRKRATAAQEGS